MNNWQKGYRLFEVSNEGPKTLYHGHNGSRILPLDKSMRAPKKQVWNPGMKTGPGYMSGWHIFISRGHAEKYLKSFTKPRRIVVVPIYYKQAKSKPRSRSEVLLARYMMIKEKDWKEAVDDY